MQTKVYHTIHDISAETWDEIHHGAFYFSHTFLSIVEKTQAGETELRYMTFMDENKPVGAAVISKFNLQLDLLAGQQKALKYVKKVFPKLFQLPIVCCGLPVSFAQNHLQIKEENYSEKVIEKIHEEMKSFAIESGCKLLAWKEFGEDFPAKSQLKSAGYFCLPSLPDMQLIYNFKNTDELVNDLRSDYKRKFRQAKALLNTGNHKNINLEISTFTQEDVSDFYNGYKAVLKRTKVKLEEYNKAFFEELAYAGLAEKIVISNHNDENITALLIQDKTALNFILVSKEKDVYADPLYPVLIKIIALLGTKKNVRQIKLGQTSMYAKLSAGAKAVPMEIYLRGENKRINFILDKAGKLLFPVTNIPSLNVWKTGSKHF